jgi:hypothetical protein
MTGSNLLVVLARAAAEMSLPAEEPADESSDAVDTTTAEVLARSLLHEVGTRLAHTEGVADQARRAKQILSEPWRSALVPAAWLHDVGYCCDLAVVHFHPLDGARYLREQGWRLEVCRLVAWHTTAEEEARIRGLDTLLETEFARPPRLATDALAWADLTSSPAGEHWSPQERIAEILDRYPPGSIVHRAVIASLPALWAAVTIVEECLARQPM